MGGKKRKLKQKITLTLYNTEEERRRAQEIIEYVRFKEQEREERMGGDDWLEQNKLSAEERIKLHKAQLLTNKWWFAVKDNYHSPWKERIEECYTKTDWKVHKAIMNCRKCEGKGAKESTEQWKQSIGKDW